MINCIEETERNFGPNMGKGNMTNYKGSINKIKR